MNSNTVFRGAAHPSRRGVAGVLPRPRHVGHQHVARQRSAVVAKEPRELVKLARQFGYRPDELIQIIEQVSSMEKT